MLVIWMLDESDRFRIRSQCDGCNRRPKSLFSFLSHPVEVDLSIPSCCSDPGYRAISPYINFNYIFLMVSSFIEDSIFIMVVENDLTGHSRRNSSKIFTANRNT